MNPIPLSLALAVALLGATTLPAQQAPRHKIESQIVGPAWVQGMIYTQSPKGSRLATTYVKDGKWVVAIDNVAGEPFDDILRAATEVVPQFSEADVVIGHSIPPAGPVAFSRDGKRYAYAGLRGGDVIVILDGKEIFRAKHSLAAPPVSLLQFSPDGKRLFFYNQTTDTLQSFRLMLDGKPATPAFDRTPPIFFSADGSRWILNGGKAKQPLEQLLVIDGQEQNYPAERARFSPDGKKVACTTGASGEQKLLVDGKVVLDTKAIIERFRLSASGDGAVIVQKKPNDQNQQLYLNGKLIAGVDGVRDIVFSPDGKRWAARCTRDMNSIAWFVVDGKKHNEYKSVGGLLFSPDSSKAVYVAESGEKKFVVTNGAEDSGNALLIGLAFAPTGNALTYVAGPNYVHVHHAGKVSPQHRTVFKLEMSPDGARCAYFAKETNYSDFYVDGEKKTRASEFGGKVIFSPDSRHFAANAWEKDGNTVYINDDYIPARRSLGVPMEFTPDSQHLIVAGTVNHPAQPTIPLQAYYVDGQEVARFGTRGVTWANSPTRLRAPVTMLPWGVSTTKIDPDAKDWEFLPDGRIVFLGVAGTAENFGPMTRITVTPAAGTTFASWFTDVKSAAEKEAAAAIAATEQAAAEKAVAAAKAKEAAAEAAAKRKAAVDAAAAAKVKARADAAAAKAAARQKQ